MSKLSGLGLQTEEPFRLNLLHPTTSQPLVDEDGQRAYIDILSDDSSAARQHEREVANRRLGKRAGRIRAEELEADATELLVRLTKGWHLVTLDGKALDFPFTADNARELYGSTEARWVRDQVNQAAADRENFVKA